MANYKRSKTLAIIMIVAAALIGLIYYFGGFKRSAWDGDVTRSGPNLNRYLFERIVENKVFLDELDRELGDPAYEFSRSGIGMRIYREVSEYVGGTRTLFGILNLGDDYTTIEEIWMIEIAQNRVAGGERIMRVYYPVHANDLTFGLDDSQYDRRGYWIHNQLPD